MLQKIFIFFFIFMSTLGFSQENIQELKNRLHSASDDLQKSEVLIEICNQYIISKKSIDSVFIYSKQLEEIAVKTTDNLLLAKTHDLNNEAHHLASNYNLAIEHGKKAIELYEENMLFKEAAFVKISLGHSYQATYNSKEAIHYFLEAEKIVSEEEKVGLYIGLGGVYFHTNNLQKSTDYFNQAYEIATRLELTQHYNNIYNGLAGVYYGDKNYTKSIEYLYKALDFSKKEKDYYGQAVCYSNIGDVYRILGDYTSAKESYETGITLFDRVSNKFIKANIHINYAEALLNLDLIDQAETNLTKAETLLNQANITTLTPNIAVVKASIAHKKGDLQQAANILEDLIRQSEKNNYEFTDLTKQIYFKLSEVYQDQNQAQKALISYKKYGTIKDSLASRIKTEEFNALKIKFEISSYEQDLKVKNQELLTAEAKETKSNYRNVLLGFISLGLIFFLYRQRKLNNIHEKALLAENQVVHLKKEQLDTEMKYKNNQITEYALYIYERNSFQDTCIEKIKHIKKGTELNDIRASLSNLQFYITENITINNEKIELNKDAKGAAEAFTFNLKYQYPNLTAKEIKVATFLVLELPSKSIANQMGINEQSVNNYRFSIRKKMGVTKKEDLVALLKSI